MQITIFAAARGGAGEPRSPAKVGTQRTAPDLVSNAFYNAAPDFWRLRMRHVTRGRAAVCGLFMCAGAAVTLAAGAAGTAESATVFGFSAADGTHELAFEQRFDAALDPADLRGWLKTLSAEPNHVGAPHNKANAELVRDLFRQWGWSAQIEEFEVLYPTLKQHSLELTAPTRFTASLKEPPIEGDATSTRTDGLPSYHEYGADGDV